MHALRLHMSAHTLYANTLLLMSFWPQAFIPAEGASAPTQVAAGLLIFSTDLLFNDRAVEQVMQHSVCVCGVWCVCVVCAAGCLPCF